MWKLLVVVVLCLVLSVQCEETQQHNKTKRTFTGWSKVGLAWNGGDTNDLWALAGNGWNQVSWIYTWSPWNTVASEEAELDFVPMLWGQGSYVTDFINALNSNEFSTSSAVLGFNEPDGSGQSNLAVAVAVTLWRANILPLKASHGLRLGAPAVSSASTGIPWLTQFLQQCSGCEIDFIPIHWYGSNGQTFIDYVTDVHNTFGINIWVTEWACVQYSSSDPDCSQQSVYNFMGWTTSWMADQDWIERWAWFGALTPASMNGVPLTNSLLTADGQDNTPLGVQYADGGYAQ